MEHNEYSLMYPNYRFFLLSHHIGLLSGKSLLKCKETVCIWCESVRSLMFCALIKKNKILGEKNYDFWELSQALIKRNWNSLLSYDSIELGGGLVQLTTGVATRRHASDSWYLQMYLVHCHDVCENQNKNSLFIKLEKNLHSSTIDSVF